MHFVSVLKSVINFRLIQGLLLLSLCLLLNGCTAMLWRSFWAPTVERPTARGAVFSKSELGEEPQYLIINYGRRGDDILRSIDYAYAFPLSNDPAYQLLHYQGSKQSPQEICADLTTEQARRIRSFTFPWESYSQGEKMIYASQVNYGDMAIDCITTTQGLTVVRYWRKGNPLWPNPRYLVIPSTQKRFATERTQMLLGCIIQTPVSLAFDVISIPIVVLQWVISG
jgi:hypothetical protein